MTSALAMAVRATCLGLVLSLAQGQWVADSMNDKPDPWGHLRFVDAEHGWAVGSMGVYRTVDGGRSWKLMASCAEHLVPYKPPFWLDVFKLAWADASRAIVSLPGPVAVVPLAVVDESGCKAVQVKGPDGFLDVQFYDQSLGWGSRDNDGAYRTTDGGKSWTRFPMAHAPSSLAPVSTTEVWGASATRLLHTTDGGETWTTVLDVPRMGGVSRVHMLSPRVGWWLGGFLYKTIDGGKTWRRQLSDTTPGDISFAPDGMEGWIAGWNGRIYHSRDGGETWEQQRGNVADNFAQVQALTDGRAWVWGDRGALLHTVDHGRNWELVSGVK